MGSGFRDEFAPKIHPLATELPEARVLSTYVWSIISLPITPVSSCVRENWAGRANSHPLLILSHTGEWLTPSEPQSTLVLKVNRRLPGPTFPILRKIK